MTSSGASETLIVCSGVGKLTDCGSDCSFMGKSIEKRMRELGAQSFYEFGTETILTGMEHHLLRGGGLR
jgi:hypothetical protein